MSLITKASAFFLQRMGLQTRGLSCVCTSLYKNRNLDHRLTDISPACLTRALSTAPTRQQFSDDREANSNDWRCEQCGFARNFSRNSNCYKCQAQNPNAKIQTSWRRDQMNSGGSRQYGGGSRQYGGGSRQYGGGQPSSFNNSGYADFEGAQQFFNPDEVMSAGERGCWSQQMGAHPAVESKLFNDKFEYNAGINFSKYDDIPVSATGPSQIPEAITSYEDVPLGEIVASNIELQKYTVPTPCQKYAIPVIKNDMDVMTCSQTGSGKTASFLIPIISNICENGPFENSYKMSSNHTRRAFPVALILAPTRELCLQIYNEAKKTTYRSKLKCAALYGGAPRQGQVNEVLWGGNVIVATPGRLLDMISTGIVGLQSVKYLVIDEADRMMDMGFEPQIRQIVQKNGMPTKDQRVTSMFSATFPRKIQQIASDFMRGDYVYLTIGRVGSTSENITQKILEVGAGGKDKNAMLRDVIAQTGKQDRVLVFANTKRQVNNIEIWMNRTGNSCVSIHGDKTQSMREMALEQFKNNECHILVATDVAARGLDIPHVKKVVNFDLPNDDVESYVHRIGRTGRVGHTGEAISFYDYEDGHLASGLMELLTETKQEVPSFLYNANPNSRKAYGGNQRQGDQRRGSFNRYDGGGMNNQYGGYGRDEQYIRPNNSERYGNQSTARYGNQMDRPQWDNRSGQGNFDEDDDEYYGEEYENILNDYK